MNSSQKNRTVRTICPFISCPSFDGIVAYVKNSRITGIEGDEDHPWSKGFACAKPRHEYELLSHPRRFKWPLLRSGTGFRKITWNEAIDVASERLGEVLGRYGPLSICSILPLLHISLFTRTLGSPNEMTNADLCQGTAEVADPLTFGDVLTIYQSSEDFRNSKCILLVGTNMAHSAGGQWLDVLHAKENGAVLIVVDPRRCESAQSADLYLQIRPGTDGALALAMVHVIIKENLYDADFVGDYCVGFDRLCDHVQQYTPEWAAGITSLSAEDIANAARIYATNRPASYRGNIGVCQHSNSTQAARAFAALIAITGNVDVRGGNRFHEPSPVFFGAQEKALEDARVPREVELKTLGADRFPLWCGPDSLKRRPHNPTVINAMITGEPYPVKAWIIENANPVLSFASADKVVEAMKRLEFTMVLAYTPSPTSDLSDLILPITHPFEQNGMRFSSYGNWLSAMPKIVEPPEGCREDMSILFDIAEAMVKKGYLAKNLIPWKNYDQLMEESFTGTGMTYQDLCEKGPTLNKIEYKRYEKSGFKTPSRKVELYSQRLAQHGYEPLPVYRECEESPVLLPRLGERYPLYLTTRRSSEYALSRSADYDWVREITPFPELHIHPSTAGARGIQDGDRVVIETPKGSIQHVAVLTEEIRPDVVNGVFGWWLPERENADSGYLDTNVNRVMSYDPPHDPEIGINRIQGVMCQVRKLT